ncbi:hypothetical protein NBRC116588_01470 [Pyruvatibacter sp. HU-CL02332]|uniref:antibiotic biosynthesis monooxygenase family protein n=1 Tax=Pyruvatibacter sp. HU-CL02332 TaxID=3127650 RepID=UPI00310A6B37
MKTLLLTCAALCLSLAPAHALDRELDDVNRTLFQSIDLNGDAVVSPREMDVFRQDVMISQDVDDDGVVTAEEHLGWGVGWGHLAEKRGLFDQYLQVRTRIFEAWDVNGDGALDAAEQSLSNSKDLYVAASNSDTPLTFAAFKSNIRMIADMNDAIDVSTEVTLINVFEVTDGALDQAIAMWTKSRDFLQTQPGYVSTALHQSITPDAKFALINVAVWESADAFKSASAAMNANGKAPEIEGLSFTPGLYTVVARD